MKIGFIELLALLLIGLKLSNIITWSWIWVLTPIWAGAALTLIILIIALIFGTSLLNRYKGKSLWKKN